jgi:antitoxin FitA
MAQALIRKIEDDLLEAYRRAAERNQRSLNAELREGLERGRPQSRPISKTELRALSMRLTEGQAEGVDSTAYIRWLRDTDGGRHPQRTSD